MGVFYIEGRGERCGVFRRLCVGILGWDFYWLEVGRGCDVLMYEFVGGVSVLCLCVFVLSLLRYVVV